MENKVPKIHLDPNALEADFDHLLMSKYDLFFRRIIEHVNNRIDNTETEDLMCRILDEEYDETFDLRLPEDGFERSLNKALEYFTFIEEYETCQFINDLKKQI